MTQSPASPSPIPPPLGEAERYTAALRAYCETPNETGLYQGSLLSRELVAAGLSPDEIVALHGDALETIQAGSSYREQARVASSALQFLLDVMIAYGVEYKIALDLRMSEARRVANVRVDAADTRAHAADLRADEAEAAGRVKTESLAMIAHELRTPISAARGQLDLMRRAIRNGRAETLPRLIENAGEALERLTRLSADLVEVSRGTPPQLTLTPLDLAAVVAQACDWAKAAAAEKGVTLIRDTSLADLWIDGDEQALLTVCGNLLTNGIRYTPAGGTVVVRLGEDDQSAWLEVQDTGIGMTAETQARVFEHYFRAPEAQTMVAQGMGVGLTLTQRLVVAHHGTVSVASAIGQGSTFRVTLPR